MISCGWPPGAWSFVPCQPRSSARWPGGPSADPYRPFPSSACFHPSGLKHVHTMSLHYGSQVASRPQAHLEGLGPCQLIAGDLLGSKMSASRPPGFSCRRNAPTFSSTHVTYRLPHRPCLSLEQALGSVPSPLNRRQSETRNGRRRPRPRPSRAAMLPQRPHPLLRRPLRPTPKPLHGTWRRASNPKT